MRRNRRIIISPYFSNNTNLVANFCKCCYLRANDVLITSINVAFLKNHDLHEYLNFKFCWILKTDKKVHENKSEETTPKEFIEDFSHKQKCKSEKLTNFSYRRIKNLRIIRKYRKFYREYVLRNNKKNQVIEKEKNQFYVDDTNNSEVKISRTIKNEQKLQFTFDSKKTDIKKEIVKEEEIKLLSAKIHPCKIYSSGILNSRDTLIDENDINNKSNHDNLVTQSKTKSPKWIPPLSPHNLIEERFYHDPWALLVVTIFLNRTSCYMALPYMDKFFEKFKGPYDILKTEISELEPYFHKIGLVRTRATQIWRMSYDFVHKDWKSAKELYGVGKYAEDAYRMFHLGDFTVQPTDRYLKIYKAWYEMTRNHTESGIFTNNSQVYLEDYYVVPEADEDRREEDLERDLY